MTKDAKLSARARPDRAAEAKRAAKVLRARPPAAQPILHQIELHQIELEMQNEELRCARLESEASLARYTELFDYAPIAYATIAPDHTICDVNHAAAQLLGKERERLRGWRFELLIASLQIGKFRALLSAAELCGGRQSCEIDLLGDSRQVEVRLSATLLRRAERVVLAFEDISEHRQREQKLLLTERALRDAHRRKDHFLATLSHELRNPLAPIRNSVFVLRRAAPGSEAAGRAQLIIDRQVTHMTRLIDDLLDVTRIARGKIALQREQVELCALLGQTLDDHRASFDALGVQLRADIHCTEAWVGADSARVVQVFSNLLANALKFTPRGGRVELHLSQQGEAAVLRIVDTGVGIHCDALKHVFEPFAQAPQTLDRARGGLGLGLAMVKGLVDLHGGSVTIQSEGLGRGTEVTVSLPLIAVPKQIEPEAAPRSRRSRRVLVIEDNLDACDTLQLALTLAGHQVEIAHDGARGLEIAAEFEPEVVVCDIGLPGIDGYEVARTLRRHETLRNVYLLALSGYAQPEDLCRAREAGFNRHLAKPTALDTLEHLIAEAQPAQRGTENRFGNEVPKSAPFF